MQKKIVLGTSMEKPNGAFMHRFPLLALGTFAAAHHQADQRLVTPSKPATRVTFLDTKNPVHLDSRRLYFDSVVFLVRISTN